MKTDIQEENFSIENKIQILTQKIKQFKIPQIEIDRYQQIYTKNKHYGKAAIVKIFGYQYGLPISQSIILHDYFKCLESSQTKEEI